MDPDTFTPSATSCFLASARLNSEKVPVSTTTYQLVPYTCSREFHQDLGQNAWAPSHRFVGLCAYELSQDLAHGLRGRDVQDGVFKYVVKTTEDVVESGAFAQVERVVGERGLDALFQRGPLETPGHELD